MVEEKIQKKQHNLIMENRKTLMISGIEDVDCFDECQVSVFTEMGLLTVRGENLHINKLSVEIGELSVEGLITSVFYSDESAGKKGFMGKLFK